MQEEKRVYILINELFQRESGKLLSALTRLFGPDHFDLCEQIFRQTLFSALKTWSNGHIPSHPEVWMLKAIKQEAHKQLSNELIRSIQAHMPETINKNSSQILDRIFHTNEQTNNMLRMLFITCHPELEQKNSLIFTLKMLYGFSNKDISKALYISQSEVHQRLQAIKHTIFEKQLPFDIPPQSSINSRVEKICLTLYFLFQDGHQAAKPENELRIKLCRQSLLLAEMLTKHFGQVSQAQAILALMQLILARSPSRLSQKGAINVLREPNRKQWNKEIIVQGMKSLRKATRNGTLSPFYLEAAIAAEHCISKDFNHTDWLSIYQYYELLYQLRPDPLLLMNQAISMGMMDETELAIHQLNRLTDEPVLQHHYMLHASLGYFYQQDKRPQEAVIEYEKALELCPSKKGQDMIIERIKSCL